MPAITLTQFQTLVANAIHGNPQLRNVWVSAEFSDLRMSGPHCYMELIEKDPGGRTVARLRANIWASNLPRIQGKFMQATGRYIASGMKVLVRGSASHHAQYGLSFTIDDIDPSYTLGDLDRIRREILERLQREGLLNRNKGLKIPNVPQRIAVISAEGAAGYGDFINQLDHNPDGFVIYHSLFPAALQGAACAASVMAALDKVEMTAHMWDFVAIIRGGGSTTDLNSFDNYDLARRVATFPIPVIVGIGHERDRCVLDEIACIRCKTPTAVAEYIIGALRNAYGFTLSRVREIVDFVNSTLHGERLRLTHLSQALPMACRDTVTRHRLALGKTAQRLPSIVAERVASQRLSLSAKAMRCEAAASKAIERESMRIRRLEDLLNVLSPANTLARGYSITRINGKALSSVNDLAPGDIIVTTLPDGEVQSEVR